jgi:hypothetical protein
LTSIAVWPGVEPQGASTIYIVSDSRISWPGGYRDDGRKVFACKDTPDIFGYYGDVIVPSEVLSSVEDSWKLVDFETSEKRHSMLGSLVKSHVNAGVNPVGEFGIVHASRDGLEMKSAFRLWHIHWKSPRWFDDEIAIGTNSELLIDLGSGARVVSNNTNASKAELGEVSRAVFTGFCDGLVSGEDPFSGGAPQLVGLWRHGMGRHFGLIYRGKKYFRGIESPSLDTPDLHWKNELFENCSPKTLAQMPDAQAQPRLRKN